MALVKSELEGSYELYEMEKPAENGNATVSRSGDAEKMFNVNKDRLKSLYERRRSENRIFGRLRQGDYPYSSGKTVALSKRVVPADARCTVYRK